MIFCYTNVQITKEEPMTAAYDIQHLISACETGSVIFVTKAAQDDASAHFKLRTNSDVYAFIANGGLENLNHINTKEWENNPNPETEIMVDAYDFYSGKKQGYIAFFFNPKTQKWIIKSFKQNLKQRPKNNAIEEQLKLAFQIGETK